MIESDLDDVVIKSLRVSSHSDEVAPEVESNGISFVFMHDADTSTMTIACKDGGNYSVDNAFISAVLGRDNTKWLELATTTPSDAAILIRAFIEFGERLKPLLKEYAA